MKNPNCKKMKFIYNTQADDLKLSFFNFLTNILSFQRIPHNDKTLPEKFYYTISLGILNLQCMNYF